VLSREQIIAPEFSSIEDYLGSHARDYYDVLATVGRGAWHPEGNAGPWIEFCLEAHEEQSGRLLQRLRDIERLSELCSELAVQHRVPDRVIAALVDAARGISLRPPDVTTQFRGDPAANSVGDVAGSPSPASAATSRSGASWRPFMVLASTVKRIAVWTQSRTYSLVGFSSVQPARSTAPSDKTVNNWFAWRPWATSVSGIRRRGRVSIVGTNPKRRTRPSCVVTVPHTAWNQPSRRDDVWSLEWT
jgi:hypothetical protein